MPAAAPVSLRRKLAAARAFGAPWTVVAKGTSNSGSMSAACDRLGVVMVATELAGGATVDRNALAIGRAGLMRLLHHFGVVSEPGTTDHFASTRFIVPLGALASVMVPCQGLLEPACEAGDTVEEGALAGRVWPFDEIDHKPRELRFTQSGIVCVRGVEAMVERGDFVAQVARETSEEELLGGP